MPQSESEDEAEVFDEVDAAREQSEQEDEAEEDPAVEHDAEADDESDDNEESHSEDSDDEGDDDAESDQSDASRGEAADDEQEPDDCAEDRDSSDLTQSDIPADRPRRVRSLSPTHIRRALFFAPVTPARSYTIEPVCAIPHPVATHCLASSLCLSHLLTGSQDGYIRDYDVFASCNGKTFLTAPQRHHCGLGDTTMKAGVLRCWWASTTTPNAEEDLPPVYSLLAHSDALWGLAGNAKGQISLFTIRHDPGRVVHVFEGHRGAVSAMAMHPDELGFFSAGWDSEALQWDLNTGQKTRNFKGHSAQLTAIAVRPVTGGLVQTPPELDQVDADTLTSRVTSTLGSSSQDSVFANGGANSTRSNSNATRPKDSDAKSDASFDPLFDDEPDGDGETLTNAAPISGLGRGMPALNSGCYQEFSQDVLLSASIDGQVILWDRRSRARAGRLDMGDKCPPWCISACWSVDGAQVYVGRRNATIDVWDVRQLSSESTPRVLKILKNPASSGPVSCVAPFPDGRHVVCASLDNIRLWNVHDSLDLRPRTLGFKIIAGHHGGVISQILIDRSCRFMISASGDRGWQGETTRTILVNEVKNIF